jgi:hypothetical protein
MCRKKLIYSFLLVCVLGWIPAGAAPKPVGWWKLDDGSGSIAADSVGTADGTLVNGPSWVAGKLGGALQFNGSNAVDLGTTFSAPPANFSISLWANIGAWSTEWGHVLIGTAVDNPYDQGWNLRHFGSYYASQWPGIPVGALCFSTRGINVTTNNQDDMPSNEAPPLNEWVHIVCVCDTVNHMKYIYFNGMDQGAMATTGSQITATTRKVFIGARSNDAGTGTADYFTGMIDDVRFYDIALSAADALRIALGQEEPIAVYPSPADRATDVLRDTALSWTAGPLAGAHDVYFGTDFDDVNNASVDSPLLVSRGQSDTTYQPPARLEFGQTYYWRVDEVNATDSYVYKGEVWRFTVEPKSVPIASGSITATASSSGTAGTGPEKTIDGSGLNAADEHSVDSADMWLSAGPGPKPDWIQYAFDKPYVLDKLLVWNSNQALEGIFGFGAKDVTIEYSQDGATWMALGDFEFAQATGMDTYAANTVVPFNNAVARYVKLTIQSNWGGLLAQKGLSEVRFLAIPVVARQPAPDDGATGVAPQTTLSWRAGRMAVSHELYVGADSNAVADGTAPMVTTASPSYEPALDLSTTYYWKVAEVNAAEIPSAWDGDVWTFSTADYVVVDDFESYTNDSPNRVFQTWIDGAGFSPDDFFPNGHSGNGTDSLVGNDPQMGDIMETGVVHGGLQSMPFYYDNASSAAVSEAIRTFETARDWTRFGVKTLTLYFYGDPNNGANQLYVKINSTKVPYDGPADNIQRSRWNQWNVDLSAIPASTLQNVTSLTIGVGNAGAGTLLIDDILLYRFAPEIPVAVDPGTTGLVAYYAFNNNVTDTSGNGNNGTLLGAPTYVAGLAGYGTAIQLNGTADAVDLGAGKAAFNPAGSFSVALWANIGAWTTSWGNVMIGNRGEGGIGWQLRRSGSDAFCFTTRGTGDEDTTSRMVPPMSEWVHFTCVYDNAANTKTIYMNGVQDRQVTTDAGARIAPTTVHTFIGGRDSGSNALDTATLFTGMLDEIRVYHHALTAGEAEFLSDPTP